MEYVRHLYTEEELKTLFKWFDAQVLPDTMQLDNATYIPDVRETLSRLKDQAVLCRENPKMQGCIILLERIKAKLRQYNPSVSCFESIWNILIMSVTFFFD